MAPILPTCTNMLVSQLSLLLSARLLTYTYVHTHDKPSFQPASTIMLERKTMPNALSYGVDQLDDTNSIELSLKYARPAA